MKGPERKILSPRYWGHWIVAGLLWSMGHCPRSITRPAGFWIGTQIARFNPKRRGIVRENLALCFPQLSETDREAMATAHFRVMGRILLDYPRLWRGRIDTLVDIEGEAYLATAQAEGRPVILLTGHSLALDFVGVALAKRHPVVAYYKPVRSPVAEWLMRRARSRAQSVLHSREHGLRPVLRSMAEGYALYYLPDEDLKREHRVFVPFFGIPKATLPTLGRLARLTGAVVLPCLGYWIPDQDRYVMRIRPPLTNFPTGDEMGDAARMNAVLEELVSERPEQYMWTFRFFRSRPAPKESGH